MSIARIEDVIEDVRNGKMVIMVDDEDRNPVETQFEAFFNDCKTLKRPLADIEVGVTLLSFGVPEIAKV